MRTCAHGPLSSKLEALAIALFEEPAIRAFGGLFLSLLAWVSPISCVLLDLEFSGLHVELGGLEEE